jgi:glycosyltransferase involved in cell wall biosynthesis
MTTLRLIYRAFRRGLEFAKRQGWSNFLRRLVRPREWLPTLTWDRRIVAAEERALRGEAGAQTAGAASPLTATRFLHRLDRGLPYGLNVSGYLQSEKGLGESARLMLASAEDVGIPTVLNSVEAVGARNREIPESRLSDANPYFFNLICLNGDGIPGFVAERGEDYLAGRYNIALWHWELQDFPRHWLDAFRYVNEVWTPSRFIQDCISRVSPVPVVRVPTAVAASSREMDESVTRAKFGLRDDQFVVLTVFDFHGVVERKNPLGMVEAFRRAFAASDAAVLMVKCTNASYYPKERRELHRAAKSLNVRFIDEVLDRAQLNGLYAMSDCYLSLHRGEGLGLTIVEAMLAGTPVIATGYSGCMEFMTPENSYPAPYRLVEIGRDLFPYGKASLWAEPDLDAAAGLLRHVKDSPDEARRKAEAAREETTAAFNTRAVGRQIRERLSAISEILDYGAGSSESVP